MKKLIVLSIIAALLLPFCGTREKKAKKKILMEVSRKEKTSAEEPKEEAITRKVALDASRKVAAQGDMRAIGNAILSYITETGKAPEANSIEELEALLSPLYIRACPTTDGWGNQFYYKYGGTGGDDYWLASAGPDGYFEGFEKTGDDIVYFSGTFK